MLHSNLNINELGHLTIAGFDTVELAKKYGTPLYVMDENKLRENCAVYREAMKKYFGEGSVPLYASKALCFKGIYDVVREEGLDIDVVSSGEIYTAMKGGYPLERAFYHGNSKSDRDINFAMDCGVGHFVVDNFEEIDRIDAIAAVRGIKQKVLLRLTPGIDSHTHKKISTGMVDSKFGVAIETGQAYEFVRLALSKKNLTISGFHCHVGSQVFESVHYCNSAGIMLQFMSLIKRDFGYCTRILDLGGGFGIRYTEKDPKMSFENAIRSISEFVTDQCAQLGIDVPTILLEPGRSIVADCGITLYTVESLKEITGFKNYIAIDGGMTDNPRYTLYQASYTIVTANKMNERKDYTATIAGCCCESGDLIAEDIKIQRARRGDILAVLSTGAYNYSMASNYNRIGRPPVVMLKDGHDRLAVRRESLDDLIACDE